jgi:hypothetical protein
MLWFKCDEIIPGVAIAVGFIAICLGGFFLSYEYDPIVNVEILCRLVAIVKCHAFIKFS